MKVSASASAMVAVLLGFVVLLSFVGQLSSALSVTMNDVECVYEFIFFVGDAGDSNFVAADHHVFWNSDPPGIDLIVTSPGALETVSFYIHVGHISSEHDLAKDEHLDPINVKIAEVREALESVTAEQKYLLARDTHHRHSQDGASDADLNILPKYKLQISGCEEKPGVGGGRMVRVETSGGYLANERILLPKDAAC
ncbi:hypothetical protein HYC85_012130 [Camellia sinensis]|uniref:GOLD domain-containing protein n=1 Tax=Camellia sinensis TaxID=4442 RepID=A0A7J7HC78_CAMSI|nr:hypothetical protein HYC85_012130 [Camellia sinensis]